MRQGASLKDGMLNHLLERFGTKIEQLCSRRTKGVGAKTKSGGFHPVQIIELAGESHILYRVHRV